MPRPRSRISLMLDDIADRLRHLVAAELQQSVVHPVAGERLLPRYASDWAISFSWCGKIRSAPPPWMSSSPSRWLRAHRRALDVPARATRAPGAFPARFARLGRFPECEIERVRLSLVDFDPGAGQQIVEVAARELAVAGERADPEVDVTVDFVGEAVGRSGPGPSR